MGLFTRKPIDVLLAQAEEGEHGLKKTLGAGALVALGIGAIIGAGLFSITGGAAANNAGPAVTISFVIAAIACAFAGLCYAEFSSMIPVAGSAYTYSYATMGEFIAWIIGWDLVLEYAVGAATVSISWSRYLTKFLDYYHLKIQPWLTTSPWEKISVNAEMLQNNPNLKTFSEKAANGKLEMFTMAHDLFGFCINMPAVFIVILMSLLLIKGTRESAWVNGIIVTLKVAVVLIFIALGWAFINTDNYTPYIPNNTGEFGDYGWSGILRAAGIIFFAYIGFDAVSTAAQEAKNPKRNMPIGILVSLAVCTILYILFAHVMTGIANYTDFKGQDGIAPVAIAIEKMGSLNSQGQFVLAYPWLNKAIILAILAGYASVILVMLMGQSRVFFSMSKDGLLPPMFSKVHPKFKTPYKSNLIFMLLVSAFAAFVPARVVGEMTSIGTLLAFVLVCAGVWYLRVKMPEQRAAFRTPLVPLIPILGIVSCFLMMISLPGDTWLRLIIWLALGFLIYFGYSKKHSKLNND